MIQRYTAAWVTNCAKGNLVTVPDPKITYLITITT